MPNRFSSTHLPRFTGEVRVGFDVTVNTLACVNTPPRLSRVERHPAKFLTLDVGHAVVPGQSLVDERVVGVDELQHAAILAHDVGEEQLGFPSHRRRSASSNAGNFSRSGDTVARLRSCSHCPAKFSTSASDLGSASIRRTCRSSVSPWLSLPSRASVNSSSSGMLLHRK